MDETSAERDAHLDLLYQAAREEFGRAVAFGETIDRIGGALFIASGATLALASAVNETPAVGTGRIYAFFAIFFASLLLFAATMFPTRSLLRLNEEVERLQSSSALDAKKHLLKCYLNRTVQVRNGSAFKAGITAAGVAFVVIALIFVATGL